MNQVEKRVIDDLESNRTVQAEDIMWLLTRVAVLEGTCIGLIKGLLPEDKHEEAIYRCLGSKPDYE